VDAFEWMRFYERFWSDRLDSLERELHKAKREHQSRRN